MRVIPWEAVGREVLEPSPVAATIGVFDGVHRGHRALLDELVNGSPGASSSMVVTFRDNPKKLLGRPYSGDLMSWPEKRQVFADLGVDMVVLIDFSASFSRMTGRDFFLTLKRSFCFSKLVLGWDFSFGKDSSTTAADLGWFADPVTRLVIVPPYRVDGRIVSSSEVRRAVAEGDMVMARSLLSYPYTIVLEQPIQWIDGRAVVDRSAVGKLLPPLGQYRVRVDEHEVLLNVEKECLTWESPPGKSFQQIVFV